MPNSMIKARSKDGYGSVAALERKWSEAENKAKEKGKAENYAYITGTFNKMIGRKKSVKKASAEFEILSSKLLM